MIHFGADGHQRYAGRSVVLQLEGDGGIFVQRDSVARSRVATRRRIGHCRLEVMLDKQSDVRIAHERELTVRNLDLPICNASLSVGGIPHPPHDDTLVSVDRGLDSDYKQKQPIGNLRLVWGLFPFVGVMGIYWGVYLSGRGWHPARRSDILPMRGVGSEHDKERQ